jgi:hypothetical protein
MIPKEQWEREWNALPTWAKRVTILPNQVKPARDEILNRKADA